MQRFLQTDLNFQQRAVRTITFLHVLHARYNITSFLKCTKMQSKHLNEYFRFVYITSQQCLPVRIITVHNNTQRLAKSDPFCTIRPISRIINPIIKYKKYQSCVFKKHFCANI